MPSQPTSANAGFEPSLRETAAAAALCLVLLFAGCDGSGGSGDSRAAAPAATAATGGSTTTSGTPTIVPSMAAGGSGGQAAFEATVYPIVVANCVTCHAGAGPGFPHIAHPDPGTAYRAVIDTQKVNLATPANSRLVQRLVVDAHFCWSGDCAADGAVMEAAILQWANMVFTAPPPSSAAPPTTGGPPTNTTSSVISSDFRMFANATKAASGRYEQFAIAIYKFETGSGNTAFDTSGVLPIMDLTLNGPDWTSGGGIDMLGGQAIATVTTSRKLYNRIASGSGTQQYSIEAWVVPANTTQEGPARIVSYSDGSSRRNFTMGQTLYNYVFRNRSLAPGIGQNGTPALVTADGDQDLQATLQHAVMTFDQVNGRQIYVNGVYTDDLDAAGPGLLVNWNQDHRFVLGNETTNNRPWLGQIKLVAIHNRALSALQILQNYLAGASQKFLLRLPLDQWLEPGAYIEFELSEFDPYSYLFCNPTIGTSNPSGFPVEGLRVAVNGVAPVASQSFKNIVAVVDDPQERLSNLCSVVSKDLGSSMDQFSVTFEVLAANVNRMPDPPPVVTPNNSVAAPLPFSGIRNFQQVNDTMAALTGLPATNGAVSTTFQELTQQLPGTADIRSFVSSNQVAVLKLALEYCDQMVESTAIRGAFFGTQFEFDQPVMTAFSDQTKRNLIIDPLIDRMVGVGLTSQPSPAAIRALLDTLIDDLTAGCTATTCGAVQTRTVVKATCAAMLSSAVAQIY